MPRILGGPKPTCFPHYVTQTSAETNALNHYDTPYATLRGFKRYWHQGNPTAQNLRETDNDHLVQGTQEVKPSSTQHTQMTPLRDGVTFTFRVYFNNLSDIELGALAWAICPLGKEGVDYCHSLGMGKPFGMGAVHLTATLHRIDRKARYSALFADRRDGTAFHEAIRTRNLAERPRLQGIVNPFENALLDALTTGDEVTPNEDIPNRLFEVERIALLLKMMEFPGFSATLPATLHNRTLNKGGIVRSNTRYLSISVPGVQNANEKNEYNKRYVLPSPGDPLFGELSGWYEPTNNIPPATLYEEDDTNEIEAAPPVAAALPAPEPAPQEMPPDAAEATPAIGDDVEVTVMNVMGGQKGWVETADGLTIPNVKIDNAKIGDVITMTVAQVSKGKVTGVKQKT